MTNIEFFAGIPNECADKDLLVDGKMIYMTIFLFNNLVADDVNHISQEDAQRVIDLRLQETMYVGLTEITRIK